MASKHIWTRIYTLCYKGLPAKKISLIIGRDKSQVSRIIKALVGCGFLVCTNPDERVKFYEATKKILTGESIKVLATYLKEKTPKNAYGGYETRVHGISFKADVISWGKGVRWDYIWNTNGTVHSLLRKDDIVFIHHKSKKKDTLVSIVPDLLWSVKNKGSVNDAVRRRARLLLGNFASLYDVRLKCFVECSGTSYAIPVRDPLLVQAAQKKTIYFDNGAVLDASHGVPEFEAPLNVMQDLLSLPDRVKVLEVNVSKLLVVMDTISNQMTHIEQLFSQPNFPDERRDVV